MSKQRKRNWIAGPAALVGVMMLWTAACDDDSATGLQPDELPESQLTFIPRSSAAPPLVTMDTTFWATKGEDSELEIRYQGQGGPGTGKEFLDLRIDKGTLLSRPDGTPFADGDSILIRVTVDPVFFLANFEPTGLTFNPNEPAQLEITYDEAEESALELEGEFDLWRQERANDPWVRIGSVQLEDFDEIEALLFGFTRYALAVGR